MRIAKLLGRVFACMMIGVILSGCGKGSISDAGQQEPPAASEQTDQSDEVIWKACHTCDACPLKITAGRGLKRRVKGSLAGQSAYMGIWMLLQPE